MKVREQSLVVGILMVSGLWMRWMNQRQNLADTFITPV